MADQNEMDKIVTPMMEHLCDHLCRFPWETERKEDLEDICAECKMDQYTNEILNTYNRVNDFQNTQCVKLLKELAIEREKQRWIPIEERLPDRGKMVLLTIEYEPFDVRIVIKSVLMIDGTWRNYGGGTVTDTPIAWRSMPEPFRFEEDR
nr:DUF551 domain-containing protein [uncultured Clostridium sp.]